MVQVLKPGMTILLVEDESALREPVRDYLSKEGYRVLDASNGADATKLAENHIGNIDVLLTDVIMPHLSGPDLANKLRARFPGMKVIFMSGYAQDKLGASGACDDCMLLQKPFTLRSLRAKLQEIATAAVYSSSR
jgi:two-component system, cell cycle sensor histidine kinase and response regulator CckA